MEAYLPRWFKHATEVLDKEDIIIMIIIIVLKVQDKEDKREMVNSHPEPGRHTRTELRRRLWLDYNFYHFCLQRLEMQWSKIK